jgi:hypothetical protein
MPILLSWSLFEVVHDLEGSTVDGPQHCSCEFGQTSPSGFESFPFLQTPPRSCRRGHQRKGIRGSEVLDQAVAYPRHGGVPINEIPLYSRLEYQAPTSRKTSAGSYRTDTFEQILVVLGQIVKSAAYVILPLVALKLPKQP